MTGQPDPRPAKRHKADVDEWKILRKLKLGPCRVCGVEQTTLHHLIPRSLGGSDVPANLVPLCGSGTTGCHGAVEDHFETACSLLRASLTATELTHVVENKGWLFVYRYLPRRSAEDVQTTGWAEAS